MFKDICAFDACTVQKISLWTALKARAQQVTSTLSTIVKKLKLPESRLFASSTGSSFEGERCGLLRPRGIQFCLIGLSVSLVAYFVSQFLSLPDQCPSKAWNVWMSRVILIHAASFVMGALAFRYGKGQGNYLRTVDNALMFFNLFLAIGTFAVLRPAEPPIFPVSLLLFTHAAFMPCLVLCQLNMAIFSSIAFPILLSWTYFKVPQVNEFWQQHGGSALFYSRVIDGTVAIGILGIVSVLINKTLYSMRKTIHQAKKLGNYFIEKELGSGGMGKVFLARHALLCRPAALKVLTPNQENPQNSIARFEREVQLSSTLTHPNTISIYDFGRTDDDTFFYAMEYLEGIDLQRMVEKFGPVEPARAIHLTIQICGALSEAHERKIIHRDIKPANIFLTCRGGIYDFVKVLDFGLAKQVDSMGDPALTKTGIIHGTPKYMAPEAVSSPSQMDHRSDIYNLGAVLYWMLTGQHLFPKSSNLELLVDHVKTIPSIPSYVSELSVPKELDNITMKCLQKDPKRRYQSVNDLGEELSQLKILSHWSQKKAKEWWELHFEQFATTGETFPKIETLPFVTQKTSVAH